MTVSRRQAQTPADRNHRSVRRRLHRLFVAGAMILTACSSSGQSGSAFVFLTVERFSLDGTNPVAEVTSSLADRNASTLVCVTLRNDLKNPTVTTPTGLDTVLIQSYTVRLTRLDGGPAPGPFTFNTAVTVPAGAVSMGAVTGNTATTVIIVVPAQAKNQSPLSPPPPVPFNAIADVTFKGRDGRGQGVEAQGGIGVVFVGSGTDSAAPCF